MAARSSMEDAKTFTVMYLQPPRARRLGRPLPALSIEDIYAVRSWCHAYGMFYLTAPTPTPPYALAQFWSKVIGRPVHPRCVPDDTEVVIERPEGPRLFFQAVPGEKVVKNRVHVCL